MILIIINIFLDNVLFNFIQFYSDYYFIQFYFDYYFIIMNIFDTLPCEDDTKKLKITCGEVYVLMNVIDISKKLFMTDLIDSTKLDSTKLDSTKLDINKLNTMIQKIMNNLKMFINNEIVLDLYYFYLSSLNEKIEKFIKDKQEIYITINDLCVISRKKCEAGLFDFSLQYKVCMYVKQRINEK